MSKFTVVLLFMLKIIFIILAVTFAVTTVEENGWTFVVYLALAIGAYEIVDLLKMVKLFRLFSKFIK